MEPTGLRQRILPGLPRVEGVREMLTLFGRKAFEYLVISLWDQDKWVRIAAADSLADLKDARSYRFLVTLLNDTDNDVRFAAAASLGKLGDTRALGPLKSACSDRNYYVRQVAKQSLEKLSLTGEQTMTLHYPVELIHRDNRIFFSENSNVPWILLLLGCYSRFFFQESGLMLIIILGVRSHWSSPRTAFPSLVNIPDPGKPPFGQHDACIAAPANKKTDQRRQGRFMAHEQQRGVPSFAAISWQMVVGSPPIESEGQTSVFRPCPGPAATIVPVSLARTRGLVAMTSNMISRDASHSAISFDFTSPSVGESP